MLPRVNPVAARESFRRSLVAYLDQVTGGNVLALAQHIRCPHSILQNWLDGATVPQLENLLRTCRFLNIPAMSLFASSGPTPVHIGAAKKAIALTGNRGVSPSRHASEIRQALLTALDEAAPRSLSEVARRLGYKDTERLYQADRKLCHKIAARYRQSGRSHWWSKPGAARICDAGRLKGFWSGRSNRTGRPRFIGSPRALGTQMTDTFIGNIRNSVGKSVKRLRWRGKPDPTICAVSWKMRSTSAQRQP